MIFSLDPNDLEAQKVLLGADMCYAVELLRSNLNLALDAKFDTFKTNFGEVSHPRIRPLSKEAFVLTDLMSSNSIKFPGWNSSDIGKVTLIDGYNIRIDIRLHYYELLENIVFVPSL